MDSITLDRIAIKQESLHVDTIFWISRKSVLNNCRERGINIFKKQDDNASLLGLEICNNLQDKVARYDLNRNLGELWTEANNLEIPLKDIVKFDLEDNKENEGDEDFLGIIEEMFLGELEGLK